MEVSDPQADELGTEDLLALVEPGKRVSLREMGGNEATPDGMRAAEAHFRRSFVVPYPDGGGLARLNIAGPSFAPSRDDFRQYVAKLDEGLRNRLAKARGEKLKTEGSGGGPWLMLPGGMGGAIGVLYTDTALAVLGVFGWIVFGVCVVAALTLRRRAIRKFQGSYPSARRTDDGWFRRWSLSCGIHFARFATSVHFVMIAVGMIASLLGVVGLLDAFDDANPIWAGVSVLLLGIGGVLLTTFGIPNIARLSFAWRHGRPPNEDDIAALSQRPA